MVLAEVEPLHHLGLGVALEVLAIEVAHEIFCGTAAKETAGVDVDNHHPLLVVLVAVDGQLEEVGALKLVGLLTVALAESGDVVPVAQVVGAVEAHLLIGRNNHVPLLHRCIPEYLRVAEVFQSVERSQHGVARILGEGASVVGAPCHALYLSVLVAGRGVEGHDGVLAVAGGVVAVDDRRTGEDVAHGVAGDGGIELLPVEEVLADGVAPMHVAPLGTVGIVLEVEVILTVLVDHAVGVVHPTVGGREVIGGTVEVGVGDIPVVAELHLSALQSQCVGLDVENLHRGREAIAQLEGHVVVYLVLSQPHVHPGVGGVVGVEHHLTFRLVLLHGQEDIFCGIVHGYDGGVAVALDVHSLGGCGLGGCERQSCCEYCD